MRLFYKLFGNSSSPALIILHGLFGSSDNWNSFGKMVGAHFFTFIPDARNHGHSPHSEIFNYEAMADDIIEFISQQKLNSISLLGHSMGGKTAALIALLRPDIIEKLIIVDIAPRSYQAHHEKIFNALISIDLRTFEYRKDIDKALAKEIRDVPVRQFLLKNLVRDDAGQFQWKMNLDVIKKNYAHINKELPNDRKFDKPTLFIKGENSDYIQMEDLPMMNQLFPKAELVTVKEAGHWVHMDSPEEFTEKVLEFLSF